MKFQTATFLSSALLKGKVMLGEEICSEKKKLIQEEIST